MRFSFLAVCSVAIVLVSCEKSDPLPYTDPVLRIGNDFEYSFNDFELYDSSTHILYFKKNHPEFDSIKAAPFIFYADTVKIYNGVFWPGYASSIPSVPFVTSNPLSYPNYTLRFQCSNLSPSDPRNDLRLISALSTRNILHTGLSVKINSLVINGTYVSFSFIVKNNDQDDLLIPDPDKMGINLFHYFTNGLCFFNKDLAQKYYCNIDPQSPASWNSWKIEWLSLLKSGDSKLIAINYTLDSPLGTGNYIASFDFPGLSHQILTDQLFQENGRIWLGSVSVSKQITVK